MLGALEDGGSADLAGGAAGDLLKPEYEGLIWLSNYNTAGTAKLVINTMIQKYGHDEGIQFMKPRMPV